MIGRFVRWFLRRFRHVRELEERIARHERLESAIGLRLLPRPFGGTAEELRRLVDQDLARVMPIGAAWKITVRTIEPGVVGVDIDVKRKARS